MHKLPGCLVLWNFFFSRKLCTKYLLSDASHWFFLKILEAKKSFENSSPLHEPDMFHYILDESFRVWLKSLKSIFPSLILFIPTWTFIFWKFHSHFRKSSIYEKCYLLFTIWILTKFVSKQITHALSATNLTYSRNLLLQTAFMFSISWKIHLES